ncbi:unnamed protein product [Lactuca saligna]|uniref:Uncharacterized protein n=1 Tax=Lactuca saligna TaxID=75948 RepID=A0AA35ULV9_LACSI|nr:unnamed protein product [Lactuca saligna]
MLYQTNPFLMIESEQLAEFQTYKDVSIDVQNKIWRRYRVAATIFVHLLSSLAIDASIHRCCFRSFDFEPKISDFGLEELLPDQWMHLTVSQLEGTFRHILSQLMISHNWQSLGGSYRNENHNTR